ncbi:phosphoglucomutase/phosphomannomutase family protein [bacterium]|nr:phosphoglucomutase/phosphomannomutase family protein [bacterium]MBU1753180.1 phosphoglucomutase/phosphomannomutase family protein [bacterium]
MRGINLSPSGWRAIIAKEFTFDNILFLAQAIADYLKQQGQTQGVVIGYDCRFLSDEFAKYAAEVLSGNQITVFFVPVPTPTPVIAYEIVRRRASAGIMITASHNPSMYNGLKFNAPHGGSDSKEATAWITHQANTLPKSVIKRITYQQGVASGAILPIDPAKKYIEHIKTLVNMELIKEAGLSVAIDLMFGCAIEYLGNILTEAGCRIVSLHTNRDPLFGGKPPDPNEDSLQELSQLVVSSDSCLGLATDGDADRFGVIDSNGEYVSSNQMIALLVYYMLKTRGQKGGVVKTITTTHLVDAIAKKYNVSCCQTNVGFRNVAEIIRKENMLIGGEESGGLTIAGHIPEKDGILGCLLTTEMLASNQKSIRDILQGLYEEFGYFFTKRMDICLSKEEVDALSKTLQHHPPKRFGDLQVTRIENNKFFMEDGSWILIRQSATEPLIRIYAEAASKEKLHKLIETGMEFIRKKGERKDDQNQ